MVVYKNALDDLYLTYKGHCSKLNITPVSNEIFSLEHYNKILNLLNAKGNTYEMFKPYNKFNKTGVYYTRKKKFKIHIP